MDKKDILEKVKNGVLSVEDALKSLEKSNIDYDNKINSIIEDVIYDDLFDFDNVVKIMQNLNWEYFDGSQLKLVSACSIKKVISNLIKDAVNGAVNQYKHNESVDYQINAGGFKVYAFIDDDSDQLEVNVDFIPRTGYASIFIKELINAKKE